jgi:small-conductance mechanosensitive channel
LTDAPAHPALFGRWRRKTWRVAALLVVVVLLTLGAPGLRHAQGQTQPEALELKAGAGQQIDGVPVLLDGQPILFVRRGIAGFTAEERAQTITQRLKRLANDDSLDLADLVIRENSDDNSLYLSIGSDVLLTINERDAQASRLTKQQAAEQYLEKIKAALSRYRQDREPRQLLRNTFYAAVSSVAVLVVGGVIIQASGRIFPIIGRFITRHCPGIRFRSAEIVSSAAISSLGLQALRTGRLLVLLVIFFAWATFILRLFPWTRAFGESMLGYFFAAAELVLAGFAKYLPNVFVLIIIVVIFYYFLRIIKPFFIAIDQGSLVIPGFYADWAKPTYNLLRLLVIALAAILGFPFLPGFDSPAFQGITVFLGLLLSLGSTSVINNMLGGLIVIYTRPFRIGDHIRVGNVIGDVVEKNFLAIRICTPANQVITIPSSTLLATEVINFNTSTRELSRNLILQTSVTLGYDVPWRQAYTSLIEAALATRYILPEPAPFVLQTKLGDHAITYQLNAFTSEPNLMVFIYSELHQNIQDKCNEAGIEILSPSYTSVRDGNTSTIPAEYLPADYVAPPFRIAPPNSQPPTP